MVPRDYVDEVISSLFEDAVDPKISVVGVGGAGGRMVSALYDREMKGVETVAVNTDPAGLSKAECDVKVLLPHTEDEDRIAAARASAESQEPELRASLSSDIVFVVAGLGGGAGTGAAPVVARAARANGAVTIGIAILPFESEGRSALAQEGLEEFRREADSVVVVDNNSLDRFADQLSFNEAMQVVSYMVVTIVKGVVDHLSKSYLTTLAEDRGSRERGEGDRGAEQPRGPRRGPAGRDGAGGVGPRARRVRRAGLHRPSVSGSRKSSPPTKRPPARASGELRRKTGRGPRDLFLSLAGDSLRRASGVTTKQG